MAAQKVIIVTGANCGIGLETAIGLCEKGHDVVISTRDDTKGEAAVAEIKAKVPDACVMYIPMELSEPESIREFVHRFMETGKPLHVLVNNAGLFKQYRSPERSSARNNEALEITMTVNCMGTFLLTNLLLDKLKETATEANQARIVNVSSGITTLAANKTKGFFIDDIMLVGEGNYESGLQSYRNSKLALNMWSRKLAEDLAGTNVIINCVCPGFIPNTGLARENLTNTSSRFFIWLLDTFVGRFFMNTQPVSKGRERLIRMAVGEDITTTGRFYYSDNPVEEAEEVLDDRNMEKIWNLCVEFSGLH